MPSDLNHKAYAAQFAERARIQAQRQAKEAALVVALADRLPPDLPVRFIHGHGYKAVASVKLPASTREDAFTLVDRFPGVPLLFYRGAYSSLVPVSAAGRELETAREIHRTIKPYFWQYDPSGYPTKASLIWWHDVDGLGLVQVGAEIGSDPARLVADHETDHWGRVLRHRWRAVNFPQGQLVAFSSGTTDTPGVRKVLFPQESASS